ncbi:MAG: RNA-binding S4 domain-containing protein [Candidatus Spyradocola sp.]|nr:RNA-binding S4 domain-containing protein [Candidatus Spyradocola sp.]
MRLDKYLKVSRIIKRRTVANEAADAGRVTVNGKVARASYEVKAGDVIEIRFGEKLTRYEVLSVQDNVGKADAAELYRVLP